MTGTDAGSQCSLSSKAAWLAVFPLVAASLMWWTVTDRLDIPKTWIALVASGLSLAWLLCKQGMDELDPAFAVPPVLLLTSLLFAPTEMGARIEAWALLTACLAGFAVARRADPGKTRMAVALLVTLPLGLLAWLQAFGLPLLNGKITGFLGRTVLATMGGPDHLGWILAGLLPWTAAVLPAAVTPSSPPRDEASPARPARRSPRQLAAWLGRQAVRILRPALFAGTVGATVLSGSRTAWVAAISGILAWAFLARPQRRQLTVLLAVLGLGILGAMGSDILIGKSGLSRRVRDLTSADGQAAGRLYILRVHFRCLARDLTTGNIFGHGPEGFQRRWPACQRSYLAQHPGEERFRSDLRHAHFDMAEVWADYGLPGIFALAWLFWTLLRGRTWKNVPGTAPAAASLTSLVVAGIAGSPAFFAPTALLMALDMGLLLPNRKGLTVPGGNLSPGNLSRLGSWRTSWPAMVFGILLLVALGNLTIRLDSERLRTHATKMRSMGRPLRALGFSTRATARDRRNPRAWIEYALDMELTGSPSKALQAWIRASQDLPSDAVLQRIQSLRHRLDFQVGTLQRD